MSLFLAKPPSPRSVGFGRGAMTDQSKMSPPCAAARSSLISRLLHTVCPYYSARRLNSWSNTESSSLVLDVAPHIMFPSCAPARKAHDPSCCSIHRSSTDARPFPATFTSLHHASLSLFCLLLYSTVPALTGGLYPSYLRLVTAYLILSRSCCIHLMGAYTRSSEAPNVGART